MKKILSATLFLIFSTVLSSSAVAQNLCQVSLASGAASYTGAVSSAPSSVIVQCVGTSTPPPVICTLPQVLNPATNQCYTPVVSSAYCDVSQISTPINGKTFSRQCSGAVSILPSSIGNTDTPLKDLGSVLGASAFPTFKYAGYSPTFVIKKGFYVSLAFTPQVAGSFQLVANTSYGDGGTITLSTSPGVLTKGSANSICVLNANASNSLYVSTSPTTCKVNIGTTYYINFADTNINGDDLCYNGVAGTCSESTVSYTLYR